jgi:3-oxoacyl-[acyl-carrier protein] reductase
MKRQGIRRLGEVEDVANLAVFLCRPQARHINGTAIAVDGGGTPGLY